MTVQRIHYPDSDIRGFMRERALQRQFSLAERLAGSQPWTATHRRNVALSTHWTRPARAVHALVVAQRRRQEVADRWELARACIGVQVVDNGPAFMPTVIVDIGGS